MRESRSPAFGCLILADPSPPALPGGAGLGLPSPKRSAVLSGAPQRESGGRTHPRTPCALALPGGRLRLRSLGAAKR